MGLRMLIYWNWGFWFNGTKDANIFLFDGIEDFLKIRTDDSDLMEPVVHIF